MVISFIIGTVSLVKQLKSVVEICLLEVLIVFIHLHLFNVLVYEHLEMYTLNCFNKLKLPLRNPQM